MDDWVHSIDVGLGLPPPDGLPSVPEDQEDALPPQPISSGPPKWQPEPPPAPDTPKWAEGHKDWVKAGELAVPEHTPLIPLDTPTLPAYDHPPSQDFEEPARVEPALLPGLQIPSVRQPQGAPPVETVREPIPAPPPLEISSRDQVVADPFQEQPDTESWGNRSRAPQAPPSEKPPASVPAEFTPETFETPDDVTLTPEQVRESAANRRQMRREEGVQRRRVAHGLPPEMPTEQTPRPPESPEDEEPLPERLSPAQRWEAKQAGRRAASEIPNLKEAQRAVSAAGDPYEGVPHQAIQEGDHPRESPDTAGGGSGALQQILEELRSLSEATRAQTEVLTEIASQIQSLGTVVP